MGQPRIRQLVSYSILPEAKALASQIGGPRGASRFVETLIIDAARRAGIVLVEPPDPRQLDLPAEGGEPENENPSGGGGGVCSHGQGEQGEVSWCKASLQGLS